MSQLDAYLTTHGLSHNVRDLDRADLERWIIAILEARKPATAQTRYRALARLFSWLVSEGEIAQSPMTGMTGPKVPENPPDVLSLDDMRRLVTICRGTSFDDRRDGAILRVLIDLGVRLRN